MAVLVPLAETVGAWIAIKLAVLRLGAPKLWTEGKRVERRRIEPYIGSKEECKDGMICKQSR